MAEQETTTFDSSFAHELAVESWTMYGVGMAIVALRIFARFRYAGWRKFYADDYIIVLSALLYTGLVVCLNVIADGGGSNLYPPGTDANFTPEDIRERIYGSKIVLVSEQCMLNVIYTLKACVLIFYYRLTSGLAHQRMVQIIAVVVACGWIATEIAFFTACRPFRGYWAVPPPNPQCTTLQNYAIIQASFNIPTDLAMLAVSLPLVYKLHVPWKQKIMVLLIFSMGLFVVTAAILTKVFNLSDVYSTSYMLWYIREASVATYVTNLPMIWPLLREILPFLTSPTSSLKKSGTPTNPTYKSGTFGSRLTGRRTNTRNEVGDTRRSTKSLTGRETIDEVNEYQLQDISEVEKTYEDDTPLTNSSKSGRGQKGDIRVVTTYTVER
ncbi:hypothetical protein MBLNU457_3330t1 [Dothideomycetes sp. NU457]